MLVKDVLDQAMEDNAVDLQALIMFLVFGKQVLSMDDDIKKLDLYYLDKHKKRMNRELKAYKKRMNIKYDPNVYEITVDKKGYKAIYILAHTKVQAESYCRSIFFEPLETNLCDDDQLMTKYNKANEGINLKIKDLKTNKIPSFLGGF